MAEEGLGHLGRAFSLTGIYNLQSVPEQASDAAAVVPPGHFGTMGQLFRRMDVCTRLADLLTHSLQAFTQLSFRFL
ncbi:hypothetical protein D3C71_2173490 [compost metagenome]